MRSPGKIPKPTVLSSHDVERLRSSPLRLWRLEPPIKIGNLEPTAPEQIRLESRLNDLAGVCGCVEGSIMGALALMSTVAYWIHHQVNFAVATLSLTAAVVIGAALVGKLARIIVARIQMRRALDRYCSDSASTFNPMNAELKP